MIVTTVDSSIKILNYGVEDDMLMSHKDGWSNKRTQMRNATVVVFVFSSSYIIKNKRSEQRRETHETDTS